MKKLSLLLILFALLCFSSQARADSITFTSSGTIDSPQVWDGVMVQNDGTVLQILGGTIGSVYAYDNSRVEMSGGTINHYGFFYGTSSFLMTGGIINRDIISGDEATIDIKGGILNITGYIKAYGGTLSIRGGVITPLAEIYTNHVPANIYGYGFAYDQSNHQLSGYLADDNPFTFVIYPYDYNLIITPEPTSLCLLAFGGLLVHRNRKK